MQAVSGALERYVSAIAELSQQWLPVQSHTTKFVIGRFQEGIYACSKAHLVRDIRQDPGLYLFCVKELSKRMPSSDHTPVELFFSSPLEWIFEIINNAQVLHSTDSIKSFQAARIKETMVAAVTSELLCPTVTIDPELGYTSSLLRQLGITLTAWNYPSEYERGLARVDADYSLDSALTDILGFSPSTLGSTFARDWRLCTEIQEALNTLPDTKSAFACSQRLVRHENPGTRIRKICEIGEALARAMQPGSHTEVERLEQAQIELVRHLGKDAIKKISQTTRKRLMHYRSYDLHMPAVASTKDLKRVVAASMQADQWKSQNIYLSKLTPEQRNTLEEVYAKLTANNIARDAIRLLVKEIIPAFGFPNGYVYIQSPKHKMLLATLTIGSPSGISPKRISPHLAIHQRFLVASAYSLKSTLRTEVVLPGNVTGTAFAARIGVKQPVGVLYLESTPELIKSSDIDPMVRIQALQYCLAAVLHAP